MIDLNHIHLLITFRCDRECDHCFVWGSPGNKGVMSYESIEYILNQAKELGTIDEVSFEGGEPFLYYPIMLKGVNYADKLGFKVEVVTDGYWGTTTQDAIEWLNPFTSVKDFVLSLSSDLYHSDNWLSEEAKNIVEAALTLGLNINLLAVENPFTKEECPSEYKGVKVYLSKLMYRGRASEKLVDIQRRKDWKELKECPYEDFKKQERVHIDPFGNIHVCQGIVIGNIFREGLSKIISNYDPAKHPIVKDILEGGPKRLIEKYSIPHQNRYADECHLCYEARKLLRIKYPNILCPDPVYGV